MLSRVDIRQFKGLQSVDLHDCGRINALIGKNNSGKSSVLHALDIAGLALSVREWGAFQPKLEIKDLFADIGRFEINLTFADGRQLKVRASNQFQPIIEPPPEESQRFKSVLILPDPGLGLARREHHTPKWVIDQLERRNYGQVNALEILFAIRYYADRDQRGFTADTYQELVDQILLYFPDLEEVISDRTEQDIATLMYKEYGRTLDILYAGTGLRHFLDVLLKTTISGASVILLDEPELGLHPDLQRRFISFLHTFAETRDIQVFLATHSQVLLSHADALTFYRVQNTRGQRAIIRVPSDSIHTVLSDLGVRPSDIFNQDLCILVEGASEVVFFEHILRTLYRTEFAKAAIGVLQYGGGAADGIIAGTIDVSNITPAQRFTFWTRDRDARPSEPPATNATQFKNALARAGLECHILAKREIEYYYPEQVHVAAQQHDPAKEAATRGILQGDQSQKYRDAASRTGICVPAGKYLRQLLTQHLTSIDQLDAEIRGIIETKLIPWKKEILGET